MSAVSRSLVLGLTSTVALVVGLACSSDDEGGGNGVLPPPFSGAGGATAGPAGGAPPLGVGGSAGTTSGGDINVGASGAAPVGGVGGAMSTGVAGAAGAPAAGAGGSAQAGVGGTGAMPTPPPPSGATACGGDTLFCENFDQLALGAITAPVNGLTPERDVSIVEEAGRGRVLQVRAGTTYGNKSGVFLNDFAPPNNSFFGRMFARVEQFPTAGGDHWVLVEATGAGSNEQVRPVGGQFGVWAPGSDGPSAGDWTDWQQSDAAAVNGAWACVEWQLNGANGGNDILLWIDGVQVTPQDRGNFTFPTFNRLWFGWVVYQNGQPPTYDLRIDDLVISSTRVGCD